MAQITTNAEKRTNLSDVINDMNKEQVAMKWQDNSVKGIIKAVEWPHPLKALKIALGSMGASVVISLILYFYGYGINQVIALLQ